EEDSPYAEVRSAVANYDDIDMPVSTIRAWTIGIVWAILLAGINQIIVYRFPSIFISDVVALLVIFPCGQAWARLCPSISVFGIPLNPGPFSIKEHVLSSVMASVAAQSAYSTEIIAVQRVFYHEVFSFLFQWMLTVSTQLIGLSLGGIMHRFLVAPPSMIWPNSLVQCALLNTLHSQQYAGIGRYGGLSRQRFFSMAFTGAVLWSFFPSYIFTALSNFSWPCWIAPNNIVINQLFGFRSGLGLSVVTFDWNQIGYIGSPLATPWWSEANVVVGFLIFYVIIAPILYYTNVWYSQYLPMASSSAFDNTGHVYNSSRVLINGSFNIEAYENYSPLYLPINFALAYGLSFIAIGATISHALIYLRKPTMLHFRTSLEEQPDIHARLMARYPKVPGWYYACVFVITFLMACLCIKLWPTGMEIWQLIVALIIGLVLVLPIAMIQAVTNRQVPMNVFTELISGFILPGHPVAMMILQTFGYITTFQAIAFTQDFKLGHYMKIPPRVMFWAQIFSTLIAGLVQLGVQMWLFTHVGNMCKPNQKDQFTCQNVEVFGTASIIARISFRLTRLIVLIPILALMFFFIIGALCPAILWLLTKKFPRSKLGYIKIIFGGPGYVPPANGINYLTWALVGFVFQHLIRRRHFTWWAKYNYVLSAALDVGTAVGLILIYFWQVQHSSHSLQYPLHGTIGVNTIQKWWGNTVYMDTLDWQNAPLRPLASGETFGSVLCYGP
ncbi:OPT oligopeptide transporter protein-domain-containing protein, partial [Rhodocollybia butyracea]